MKIAIDPGLDVTGWALFRGGGVDAVAKLRALAESGDIETLPGSPTEDRIQTLVTALRHVVRSAGEPVELAMIERPTYSGTYARHGAAKISRQLSRLYMAIGACTAACIAEDVPVVFVDALRRPKSERAETLRLIAKTANVGLPVGPRGGVPEDVWDAIYLGVRYL